MPDARTAPARRSLVFGVSLPEQQRSRAPSAARPSRSAGRRESQHPEQRLDVRLTRQVVQRHPRRRVERHLSPAVAREQHLGPHPLRGHRLVRREDEVARHRGRREEPRADPQRHARGRVPDRDRQQVGGVEHEAGLLARLAHAGAAGGILLRLVARIRSASSSLPPGNTHAPANEPRSGRSIMSTSGPAPPSRSSMTVAATGIVRVGAVVRHSGPRFADGVREGAQRLDRRTGSALTSRQPTSAIRCPKQLISGGRRTRPARPASVRRPNRGRADAGIPGCRIDGRPDAQIRMKSPSPDGQRVRRCSDGPPHTGSDEDGDPPLRDRKLTIARTSPDSASATPTHAGATKPQPTR